MTDIFYIPYFELKLCYILFYSSYLFFILTFLLFSPLFLSSLYLLLFQRYKYCVHVYSIVNRLLYSSVDSLRENEMEAGKYDITDLLTVNLQWVRAAQQAASNTPAYSLTNTHTHIQWHPSEQASWFGWRETFKHKPTRFNPHICTGARALTHMQGKERDVRADRSDEEEQRDGDSKSCSSTSS